MGPLADGHRRAGDQHSFFPGLPGALHLLHPHTHRTVQVAAPESQNVLQELHQLSRDGYQMVVFTDENLTVSTSRMEHLSRLIIQSNLKMRFAFEGFVEHLPDSTLGLMRQAGFDLFFMGVETGSEPQRRRYHKPGSAAAVARGIQRAKEHHFLVYTWLMIGGPGETRADLENTKDFLIAAKPHLINIGNLRVHPGSQLWNDLVGPGNLPP